MSCDEDIGQCRAIIDCGIPVVTSEFLLTGILQQKVDIDAYPLQLLFTKYFHVVLNLIPAVAQLNGDCLDFCWML